jgi:hypothetical protein
VVNTYTKQLLDYMNIWERFPWVTLIAHVLPSFTGTAYNLLLLLLLSISLVTCLESKLQNFNLQTFPTSLMYAYCMFRPILVNFRCSKITGTIAVHLTACSIFGSMLLLFAHVSVTCVPMLYLCLAYVMCWCFSYNCPLVLS